MAEHFEGGYHSKEEPTTVEVDQDEEWKFASPAVIETTGLGPCFGIIIYDPESKSAFLGHFVDPRTNGFDGMLAEAKKHFKDFTNLQAYVGGGEPNPDDAPYFKEDKAKRTFVKNKLLQSGFNKEKLKIKYQDSNQSTILRIDTVTGNVDWDTEDEDNY